MSDLERTPNVRLLADRVLVKLVKATDETTKSGIILSAALKEEKSVIGEVIRLSHQVKHELKEWEKIEEGDQVMFSAYAGSDVSYRGLDFKILRITDIFGVLEAEQDE